MPPLLWPGWALRLMPPDGFGILSYRAALGVLLMAASGGASDYRTAQQLLGLQPIHDGTRFAAFLTRLREHGILDPVLAAICQLARNLDEHGAPIDYARRRRLPTLSQAQLDLTGWRRQRDLLTSPWNWHPHASGTGLPAAFRNELFARSRLIELLTGTHPCYLPEPLRLPGRHGHDYAEFAFTLPEPMTRFLHQRAHYLLHHAGIDEPVSWEPPDGWVTGITWPGPHPSDINPGDLHPLLQSSLPAAAMLGTTAEHIRLAAARHPAPQLPPGSTAPRPAEPPGTQQLQAFTRQGLGLRKIARITGCSEHTIRQLLRRAPGSGSPPRPPAVTSTRTGCASNTRHGAAASKTSPPEPASRPEPSPPQPAPPASRSGTAPHQRPRPPAGQPRRTRRIPASGLGRLLPPARRTAHPQAPGSLRACQPSRRRLAPRHPAHHPGQPDPPARSHHRHHAAVHRPGPADRPDRRRRAVRP